MIMIDGGLTSARYPEFGSPCWHAAEVSRAERSRTHGPPPEVRPDVYQKYWIRYPAISG